MHEKQSSVALHFCAGRRTIMRDYKEYNDFNKIEVKANNGDIKAMILLAFAYRYGIGTDINHSKYFEWIEKAANAGETEAMIHLAFAYRYGIGTEINPSKYFEWMEKSANAGNSYAMGLLAFAYRKGIGTEIDPSKYFEWMEKSANAGETKAMISLALTYKRGIGTDINHSKYFEWIEKAANAGETEAMIHLAFAYRKGIGTEIDPSKYFEWMEKSANAGNANAMYLLAKAYITGYSVDADTNKYVTWISKAANIGHEQSIINYSIINLLKDKCDNPEKYFLNFYNIVNTVNYIKLRHTPKFESLKSVAHFTSIDTLDKMLQKNQDGSVSNHLRLYNSEYLNDPGEGQRIFDYIKNIVDSEDVKINKDYEDYKKIYDFLSNNGREKVGISSVNEDLSIYISSFTSESDRLDLWRAYGNDGNGVSIVIPIENFKGNNSHLLRDMLISDFESVNNNKTDIENIDDKTNIKNSVIIYEVKYEDKDVNNLLKRIKGDIINIIDSADTEDIEAIQALRKCIVISLIDIMYLYKNSEYKNEKEYRIIRAENISSELISIDEREKLYIKTEPILFYGIGSKIIFGPKVKDKKILELKYKYKLRLNNFNETLVCSSKIPYR